MQRDFRHGLLTVVLIAVGMLAQGEPLSAQVASPQTDAQDLPGLLVSRQLLEAEALVVGDVVRLSAEETDDGARPFRIVGVYEPTPNPLRIRWRCASRSMSRMWR